MTHFKAMALISWLVISSSTYAAAGPQPLSRSIYIPVIFSVPPEISSELLIWIGDEETPRHPQQHTFLFTFFPDKGDRFFPEQVEVRIRAAGVCDGTGIDTNLIITPSGIVTGKDSLAFDMKEVWKQVRARRRDVRVKPKVVRIRCHSTEAAEAGVDPLDPR